MFTTLETHATAWLVPFALPRGIVVCSGYGCVGHYRGQASRPPKRWLPSADGAEVFCSHACRERWRALN